MILFLAFVGDTDVSMVTYRIVASMQLGGSDPRNLTAQGIRMPRAGFETAIAIPDAVGRQLVVVQIAALDADGNVLGHTDVVDARTGERMSPVIQFRG